MKNKDILIRAFVITLLVISIIWEVTVFITSPGHRLAQLPKQLLLSGILVWMIMIMFKQNQDDDDWAGQY